MTQIIFGPAVTPQLTDLDSNFSELYGRTSYMTASGGTTTFSGPVTAAGTGSTVLLQSQGSVYIANNAAVGGWGFIAFDRSGTVIGSITQSGTTGVAYNTSSDYRLKENVAAISGSGAFIDALRPCTWTWKSDGSGGAGFIAHELQAVSPNSVTGIKDAVDELGRPIFQAVEYGSAEVIAMLVAEVKALRTRVHALDGN